MLQKTLAMCVIRGFGAQVDRLATITKLVVGIREPKNPKARPKVATSHLGSIQLNRSDQREHHLKFTADGIEFS